MIYDATIYSSVTVYFDAIRNKSLLTQDEPGGNIDFQYKVSLKQAGNSFMIGACN